MSWQEFSSIAVRKWHYDFGWYSDNSRNFEFLKSWLERKLFIRRCFDYLFAQQKMEVWGLVTYKKGTHQWKKMGANKLGNCTTLTYSDDNLSFCTCYQNATHCHYIVLYINSRFQNWHVMTPGFKPLKNISPSTVIFTPSFA